MEWTSQAIDLFKAALGAALGKAVELTLAHVQAGGVGKNLARSLWPLAALFPSSRKHLFEHIGTRFGNANE